MRPAIPTVAVKRTFAICVQTTRKTTGLCIAFVSVICYKEYECLRSLLTIGQDGIETVIKSHFYEGGIPEMINQLHLAMIGLYHGDAEGSSISAKFTVTQS